MSYETIEKAIDGHVITAENTVKEIRKIVKQIINGDPAVMVAEKNIEKEKINEEEIPMAYDPTKEYEFEYFQPKSKNMLLNIIMSLQDAYQKLKNKRR